jgi:hypothetical protein
MYIEPPTALCVAALHKSEEDQEAQCTRSVFDDMCN